ncbi:CST complex subunit TEN1 [Tachyglossus aculeatus]|uniref:CST complex subunit TEN1 n=1 Tax=Tachyglossus aculeatus TaxID=9261 RepID=UPI0018F2FDCC|nr:CST complex subunit TEN1 [Tachyglossus aculeatus]XP_038598044.1 CST complex subunit TEN1 [Tachyglossus aculeatus]
MLPEAGGYRFPWEVSSGLIPEGTAVRTFGRLHHYDVVRSRVVLRAQRGPTQHNVLVSSRLVEPFRAQTGSLYMVLGEFLHGEDGEDLVQARVLTCVEGMNLPLLERAIRQQRAHLQDRGQPGPEPGSS